MLGEKIIIIKKYIKWYSIPLLLIELSVAGGRMGSQGPTAGLRWQQVEPVLELST